MNTETYEQETINPPATNGNKTKLKNIVLIILFAIVFSFVVQDGVRIVIQKIFEIPTEYIGLAQWGDTFFLRIFSSLFAMTAGVFVIGTFLKEKARLSGVIATLPTTLFWIAILIFGTTIITDYEYSFESIKAMLLLPAILIISLPIVGYYGSTWGQTYVEQFQRHKSILKIKWYHWLWIFPFYLNKVIAIPLFTLIILIKFDFSDGWTGMYPGLLDFITNWGYYLGRIILLFILVGLITSVNHVYTLLTEEKTNPKKNWRNGVIIFGHVLLFSILYVLFFGEYL